MINGMAMPAQMELGKVAATSNSVNNSSPMQAGQFGVMLASLTSAQPITEELPEGIEEITDAIAELLQMTTVEEVEGFLQERGYEQNELLEVVGEHILVHDESLIELLTEIIPGFEQMSKPIEGEAVSVDLRELFALLEEVSTEVMMKIEQNELPENLSKDDLIMLLAVMQMAAIEGPKVDLTLKQEQQLHSLQQVLGKLNEQLNDSKEKSNEIRPFQEMQPLREIQTLAKVTDESVTRTLGEVKAQVNEAMTRPAQEGQPLTKLTNELTGQPTFSIPASAVGESAKVEGETTGNSRAEMLMKELQNVFKRANFGQAGGTHRISIKLYPEHLGQLRIELLQTNGLLTARILASNALGKDMLESQLHQLRQAFLQQNIQVERIDISQMMTETPYDERNNAFNQHFKQDQEHTNEHETHEEKEEIMSFEEYMIELEA